MPRCRGRHPHLGRFDAGLPPKTYDEMYDCATNEFERSAITDMLFGSVTDVLDRYLPDKDKHGAIRGMLSVVLRALVAPRISSVRFASSSVFTICATVDRFWPIAT